jgi:hypothetical protein
MAQAVTRQLLNAEARFRAKGSSCGIYGGNTDIGTGFLKSLKFSAVSSQLFHHPSMLTRVSFGGLVMCPLQADVPET